MAANMSKKVGGLHEGEAMTVDELIAWLESAKDAGGQEVGSYKIVCFTEGQDITEVHVDHSRNFIDLGW